jgi:hypothetical protein
LVVVVDLRGGGTKWGIGSGELLPIDAPETHFVEVPFMHSSGKRHCSYLGVDVSLKQF